MQDRYTDDDGVAHQGKAQAYCVKAKEFLNGKKLDGDLCSCDWECLLRQCGDEGRCVGLAEGDFCSDSI